MQFKRTEGGTALGNFMRSVANKQTNGLLGNGNFMIQKGETKQDATKRAIAGLAAGITAANDYNDAAAPPDDDGIMSKVKKFALPVGAAVVGVIILRRVLRKKKK